MGATIKDPDGNVFIDLTGGLGANNTGHTHPRVVQTIIEQAPKLMHTLDMVNVPELELSKALAKIMPGKLKNNCFTCYATSGSAAIEIAIKYAKYITKTARDHRLPGRLPRHLQRLAGAHDLVPLPRRLRSVHAAA